MSNSTNGLVKWFSEEKGFAFITQDNSNANLFFHFSAIASEGFKIFAERQKVSFEVQQSPKGLQAENVIAV